MLEEQFMRMYRHFRLEHFKDIFRRTHSDPHGLSATEAYAAEVICLLGEPTAKTFAEFLGISQPNATYRLNALISKGYVVKKADGGDRRETHLKVTDKFLNYYGRNAAYIRSAIERVQKSFSPEEVRLLTHMLRVIADGETGETAPAPQPILQRQETFKEKEDRKMVRIITDSTADISAAEGKRMGVQVVPLTVSFGEESFLDGVDITPEVFYERLVAGGEFPKTSQPSPERYMQVFEEVKAAGETAVVITVSGEVSGTLQSALIARQAVGCDEIYVVDSRVTAMGMRMLVDVAVKLREEGKSAKEIAAELDEIKERIVLYAAVDTLEYLYKGGRLSATGKVAGTLLGIKPIITFAEGKVSVAGKVRGLNKAVDFIVGVAEERKPDFSLPHYFGYTKERGGMDQLIEAAKERLGIIEAPVSAVGCTIGAHAGPGAAVLAYFAAK